jgi:SAM-dependent methyltransferase
VTLPVTIVRYHALTFILDERLRVTTLSTKWTTFLNHQHRYPTGLAGRIIGERMIRQHTPETIWTIDLLNLRPADHVLELGCGAGRGLELAAQQSNRGMVTGIDVSATMVHAAYRRNRATFHSGRLALLRSNVTALPFTGQHFDKIFSIHSLYFWPDPLPICLDLVGMLNIGGMLVITVATGQVTSAGEWVYWPLQQQLEALVGALQQCDVTAAVLKHGPNSRQYNNIAIVLQK